MRTIAATFLATGIAGACSFTSIPRALAQTAQPAVTPTPAAAAAQAVPAQPSTPPAQGATPAPATTPPAPPPPAATPHWYDMVQVGGLVDGYFGYRPNSGFLTTNEFHVFDVTSGTFNLSLAKLTIQGTPSQNFGFRMDLGYGTAMSVVSASTMSAYGLPAGMTPADPFLPVEQAYAHFALPGTPLTIDFGRFVTQAGAEVIDSNGDWNYSRGILFGYAIPFTHTGVRATFAGTTVSGGSFQLVGSVVNGWNTVIDNNKYKTIGLSAVYSQGMLSNLAINTYFGPEAPAGVSSGWRELVDAVATLNLTSALTVTLNPDWGHDAAPQGNGAASANWMGAAAYARYVMALSASQNLNLTLRVEDFMDKNGAMTGYQNAMKAPAELDLAEGTLTIGLPLGSQVELRADLRADHASQKVFHTATATGSNLQETFELGAVAWF